MLILSLKLMPRLPQVLDGFSTLFAVGDSVASVVEVTEETDPDVLKAKRRKRSQLI